MILRGLLSMSVENMKKQRAVEIAFNIYNLAVESDVKPNVLRK